MSLKFGLPQSSLAFNLRLFNLATVVVEHLTLFLLAYIFLISLPFKLSLSLDCGEILEVFLFCEPPIVFLLADIGLNIARNLHNWWGREVENVHNLNHWRC
jgi:hypothetical protein